MNVTSVEAKNFKRNKERRTATEFTGKNRRNSPRRNPDLNWVPLFRSVDTRLISQIIEQCEVVLLPPGTPLLKPGEVNHNVYILLSGDVAAHLDSKFNPGTAIPIAVGECIGELSAIDGKPVSALVMALTEARVLELSGDVFWNQIMVLPGVASNLMISLTERMRRSNEQALKSQREQLELLHIRKELDVARQLQISMLPLQSPLFPERQDIEVCGYMEPASDVGGDLFDAFFVDDEHLFFCIGDVSGHGIAAALFMARIVGLLRIMAMGTLQPDKLLEAVNDRLCEGNEANIFVTMLCGYLNVRTGELIYSNGGHCAPIIGANGQHGFMAIPQGTLVAAFPGMPYSAMRAELHPGDLLFCYTDGVTEAQKPTDEEFSEDRCLEMVARNSRLPLQELLATLRTEVSNFTGTELLADDCTMLAMRRPAAQ